MLPFWAKFLPEAMLESSEVQACFACFGGGLDMNMASAQAIKVYLLCKHLGNFGIALLAYTPTLLSVQGPGYCTREA